MKKGITLLLSVACFMCSVLIMPLHVQAADTEEYSNIEMLDNGYYYETIIEDEETPIALGTRATTQSVTKTKTTKLKNSDGDVLWSVSIKATFSYDGTTSKCTSCTPSAEAYASSWSIKSVTSSKSGNSATATAVATHTLIFGIAQDTTKSITIQCSATGVVS